MRAYIRRWAPFWGQCVLTGLAFGLTFGATALAWDRSYVSPVWVVLLAASLRHLWAGGIRTLAAAGRRALGLPDAPAPVAGQGVETCLPDVYRLNDR